MKLPDAETLVKQTRISTAAAWKMKPLKIKHEWNLMFVFQ